MHLLQRNSYHAMSFQPADTFNHSAFDNSRFGQVLLGGVSSRREDAHTQKAHQ